MKKLILLIASAVMAAALLASCGEAKPSKPTNVFRETLIEMPEEFKDGSGANIQNTVIAGDTAYMIVYRWDRENRGENYWIQPVNLTDGKFGEKLPIEMPSFENGNGGAYPVALTADKDGNVYLMLEIYGNSENGYTQTNKLYKYAGGKCEELKLELPVDEETGERFYVSSMEAADNGILVLHSWNGLCLVAPDGTAKLMKPEDPNNMQYQQIKKIDGRIFISIWEYSNEKSSQKLVELDLETGEFGKELKINSNHIYNMMVGPGYDYYFNDRSAIWGVDAASGEMTELLNFINSDINTNDLNTIVPLSADRFFYSYYHRPTVGNSYMQLAFLDRVPDDQVVEKKMLRLAVDYMNYDLRTKVIAFNKANDEYRITIDDYSRFDTDENYNASYEKLNQDIIQGNVPDLFILSTEMPYATYAAKGIFADLYELMDADESFDRSQYLDNIFKAYEYDGKLLSIVPSFEIMTFAASEKYIGDIDGWTMEEFMAFAKAHPDMSMFDFDFNRSRFIELMLLFGRAQFIDDETGKCSFDSPAFKQLLEFAKSLGEENFWDSIDPEDQMDNDFWMEYEDRFVDGRVLLLNSYLYNIENSIKSLLNYELKAEPVFVGFPVDEGNGALIRSYGTEYAIARRSDFKEGAWEFIKTMLMPEAQMPFYNEQHDFWEYPVNGIPIYRPALEKMCEIAMTPPDTDENDYIIDDDFVVMPAVPFVETAAATVAVESVEIADEMASAEKEEPVDLDGDGVIDGIDDDFAVEEPIIKPVRPLNPWQVPLTEAQVDKVMALITGTTHVERYDQTLNDIINEELEMYFAGAKSVDETAKLIQNRVNIYINESR